MIQCMSKNTIHHLREKFAFLHIINCMITASTNFYLKVTILSPINIII